MWLGLGQRCKFKKRTFQAAILRSFVNVLSLDFLTTARKLTMSSEIGRQQQTFFEKGTTKSISFRKKVLKDLQKAIVAHEDAICEALYNDFRKPKFESLVAETQFVLAELKQTIKNLGSWAQPQRVRSSWSNFPSTDYIHFEPYGKVLVIAPWNYPFTLALTPAIGAIAAGNTVVIKPSELTPHTSAIISKIIAEVFDKAHVAVVEGGVKTAQDLLAQNWDYIFFTGSTRVGKIVYQKAAENLTPVTLELGGKCPCIIDETANIKLAARRISFGKFLNAGQTCLAPDYILVHQKVKNALIEAFKKTLGQTYGEDVQKSPDFARVINNEHYKRLVTLMDGETILFGGNHDPNENFIAPTLVDEPSIDSALMEQEIFGPLLPIIGYEDLNEVDRHLKNYGKPLALYVFSNQKSFQRKIIAAYSFGGGTINDTVIHIANKRLPFGGVGKSGIGSYHGKHSFALFSHRKSIVKKATWLDIKLRYAPYTLAEAWVKKFKHLF